MIKKRLFLFVLFVAFFGCTKQSHEDHSQHGTQLASQTERDALAVAATSTNSKVFSNQALVKPLLRTHADTVKAYGYVTLDERRSNQVAARVGGRIEKLYVKYENQYVKKGQKIMDLYSVDLNASQVELLYAYKADPQSEIVEHAGHKLKLLGVTDEQINHIKESGRTFSTITIYSPYDGYIFYKPSAAPMTSKSAMSSFGSADGMGEAASEKSSTSTSSPTGQVREGVYVSAGQTLFWINDLREVWGILSVGNRQMEEIGLGDSVDVMSEMVPSQPIQTMVRFIEPQYSTGQKFVQMRVYLTNKENKLRINSLLDAAITPKNKSLLTLPASSIMYLGSRQAVWRKVGETAAKSHILQIQFVQLGSGSKGRVSVLSGLAAKDEVALDAGYLMDRESLVKPELIMNKNAIYSGLILLLIITGCTKKMKESHQDHDKENADMITLNEQQRLVVNLKTDSAQIKKLSEETTLIGTATVDERGINIVSARVKGRLDRLFVRNPGTYVRIGDPLYSIYSEELLAYENEYLMAIQENKLATTQKELTRRMVESARRRLELWTLTEEQINDLEKPGKISSLITFYSNRSGSLTELLVREGGYVEAGTALFQLADLSSLWVEAQFYSGEINYLGQSPTLEIEFEAFPGERIRGEVEYTNPRLEDNTKINLVRIRVDNKLIKYKPGMMAYVFLKRNEKHTLVIPKSALLVENNIIVWVEMSDGMFMQHMVTIGIQNKREVEVLSGLSPGDRVVTHGAFLLNSAWKVKQGGGAMQGMKM